MIKKENLSENSYIKEDMDSISSNQKAHSKSISSSNKEYINKKPIFKKDSIKSTDNESDLSQKKLSEKIKSSFFKNNFPKNSAFKQIINPVPYYRSNFYVPFNYNFNTFQQYLFFNLCSDKYYPYVHFVSESQNKLDDFEKYVKESLYKSGNSLLNKKRKIKTIIFAPNKVSNKNILQKNENGENKEIRKGKKILFQIFKKRNYYKEAKILKKKVINEEMYCCHPGCSNSFKTQKQVIFHHYKMAPECQEDTIYFLRAILEIKKMFLKNIDENTKLFDKFSKLYESAMKEIALTDHINTITGKNLKDKLD
jgi:hypothetical protein